MTMPYERTCSVLQTYEFLKELRDPEATPGVPDEIRRQAHGLLSHFPEHWLVGLLSRAVPEWFGAPAQAARQSQYHWQ